MALGDLSPLELRAEQARLKLTVHEIARQIEILGNAIQGKSRELAGAVAGETELRTLTSLIEQETGVTAVWSKVLGQLRTMEPQAYFGRIDFVADGEQQRIEIYVGTGWLWERSTGRKLVYDWRTPVCDMYYKYEPGRAGYKVPDGGVSGEILLKRTYKVRQGELLEAIDSSGRTNDEVLRDMLRRSTDGKMRTIVQTIQREQDDVIRNDEHPVLLVQGCAGSGKTSVALHRVAYLLYTERGALSASNVMMLSPNPVFKDYISTVLPQLGEENVQEGLFREVALQAFPTPLSVEEQWEQIEYGLTHGRDQRAEAMELKSSQQALKWLQRYADTLAASPGDFPDLGLAGAVFPGAQLRDVYNDGAGQPMQVRFNRAKRAAAAWLESHLQLEHDVEVRVRESAVAARSGVLSFHTVFRDPASVNSRLRGAVESFLGSLNEWGDINLGARYRGFYQADAPWAVEGGTGVGETGGAAAGTDSASWARICDYTRRTLDSGRMHYEDLALHALLGLALLGMPAGAGAAAAALSHMRHVIIDEVQDYTPAEYRLIRSMFPRAKLTMLGDLNQSVNPMKRPCDYDDMLGDARGVHYVELRRSYRSTTEIMDFASAVVEHSMLRPVETIDRHGDKPRLVQVAEPGDIPAAAAAAVASLMGKGCNSIAVVCKTATEASMLHSRFVRVVPGARLVMPRDTKFAGGTIVLPVYMAKGLEFDGVVVCDAGACNYTDPSLRRALYTACTRAMHQLVIVCSGQPSELLPLGRPELYERA